jgi:hypothetical protein
MKAGRTESNVESTVIMTPRFICECTPRSIFKSETGICPKCMAVSDLADKFMADKAMNLSPTMKKAKYDDFGNQIDEKPKPTNKPVKTEGDYRNERRAKNRKK